MYVVLHVAKVPVILFRFWWNSNFLASFSKNTQISISLKSVQWEPTERRTDRHDEANNAFRNFIHAPTNDCQIIYSVFSKEHGPSLGLHQPHIHTDIKTAWGYIQRFQYIRFSINTIRFVNRLKSLLKQTDTWTGTKCKPCDRPATGFPLY